MRYTDPRLLYLLDGENRVILKMFGFERRVSDGQTDGQTNGRTEQHN